MSLPIKNMLIKLFAIYGLVSNAHQRIILRPKQAAITIKGKLY